MNTCGLCFNRTDDTLCDTCTARGWQHIDRQYTCPDCGMALRLTGYIIAPDGQPGWVVRHNATYHHIIPDRPPSADFDFYLDDTSGWVVAEVKP